MKILIAPLAALAETKGPFSRARALVKAALDRGHKAAFCAALDYNYQPVEGAPNYPAPCPSPFGTPLWLGRRLFKLASRLGVQQRRNVRSFEEVLYIMGASHPRFFPRDVQALCAAMRAFQPDVVFAEFRPAAIVAAKLENIPVVTGYSYPVQTSYANSPQYGGGVRDFVRRNNLPPIHSALEVFDWAELKFVASSYELEPIPGEQVFHVGPFIPLQPPTHPPATRKRIMAYMGTGTISSRLLRQTLIEAFANGENPVHLASQELLPEQIGSLQIDRFFDFNLLMPETMMFINHGGQNSIMTGLVHGAPQAICPGRVFERQYNARSVEVLGAGRCLKPEEFTAAILRELLAEFAADPTIHSRALAAGKNLMSLGGVQRVLDVLESRYTR